MNIIIVGAGKVGLKLAEKLSQENEHDITLIDLKYQNIEHAVNQYDVMGVTGDAISQETLKEAGIEKADLLIAVTGNDELNLITCLIAKKCGHLKTIARIRRPEYNKDIHLIREDLGLAMVINPEQAAAHEMARVLRFPSAIQIDTFSKGRVEILKFRIHEDSPLDNMRIADLTPKLNCDILVCGVERDDEAFIPGGDFVLKEGDYISIVSSVSNGAYFFKKIGIKTSSVKDTIIVGGGDTAYYLANRLIQTGISVKIIEQDEKRCDELFQLLPKATIINGDGTDKTTLLEAGLEYAESFVALTNIDEENVLLSLYAKSKDVKKIVTKVNRIEYDNVLNSLELDSIFYPKNITTEYILRFVRARNQSRSSNIETVHLILDGKAEALEFRIKKGSPISDIPIMKLHLKPNILIACITRGGQIIIPRGHDIIKEGDSVIIVTTEAGFDDISDILQ
ncbi:MAG: Trk system potassium transporter TrkA [Clostridia bacterium]|nr:Trk system potassium transporter TrkA [Clostridia bacterium]